MCGRFSCTLHPCRLATLFNAGRVQDYHRFRPKYNLTPENFAPIVFIDGDNVRVLCYARFGLVPSFAQSAQALRSYNTINARLERVRVSPLYRRLLHTKRCVIPVDGIYEWSTTAGKRNKTPYFFRLASETKLDQEFERWRHRENDNRVDVADDGLTEEQCDESLERAKDYYDTTFCDVEPLLPNDSLPLFMAGFYDTFKERAMPEDEAGSETTTLTSFTLLTMSSAKTVMEPVHSRTPVFLTSKAAVSWLNRDLRFEQIIEDAVSSCRELSEQNALIYYEVPAAVGNIRHNFIDLALPVKAQDSRLNTPNHAVTMIKSTKEEPSRTPERASRDHVKEQKVHDVTQAAQSHAEPSSKSPSCPRKREQSQVTLTHFFKKLKKEP